MSLDVGCPYEWGPKEGLSSELSLVITHGSWAISDLILKDQAGTTAFTILVIPLGYKTAQRSPIQSRVR